MGRHHFTQIVVDRHGIAETDGEVIAYAPMQRVRYLTTATSRNPSNG